MLYLTHPLQKVALINALNAIAGKAMLEEGRVYGGGMHKLEPKELSNVPVPDLLALIKNQYCAPPYTRPPKPLE